MAINFLNNINLNSIQIENIVIEKFASDAAAGTGVVGQLYFDTTADTLKQYVSDTVVLTSILHLTRLHLVT